MKRIFLLATFLLSFLQIKADEGMWLLMLIKRLNGVDMQKQGLHLTPEEIYSVKQFQFEGRHRAVRRRLYCGDCIQPRIAIYQPSLWLWEYCSALYTR